MDTDVTPRYGRFTGMAAGSDDTADGGAGQRSYVLDRESIRMVDFAIRLGKPLLVEGEAGCGKTRLADLISEDLGLEEPYIVPVRSTSRANDLFYRYDALRRLQDSQLKDPESIERSKYAHNYVELEPLGRAIKEGWRRVILIDEIDKADADLPNDLLHALDRFQFTIDEIPEAQSPAAVASGKDGHWVTGPPDQRPIIIFTSNRERQLPKPFLRRCIFLELTFPADEVVLAEIVAINLLRPRSGVSAPALKPEELSRSLIEMAVKSFLKIRRTAELNNAYKKPSTSELIDWIHVLHWEPPVVAGGLDGLLPPHWKMLYGTGPDAESHRRHAKSAEPEGPGA